MTMVWVRFFVFAWAMLVLPYAFKLPTAAAQEVIQSFDVVVNVQTDGALIVHETITVHAEGQKIKRGIYRDIPTVYRRSGMPDKFVTLDVLDVYRNGEAEPYHTADIRNGRRIYMGKKSEDIARGLHEYTLRYKTDRQLRFFDGYDELYWNVTGNEWDFPIRAARVRVVLPDGAAILAYDGYTGYLGGKGKDFRVHDPIKTDSVIAFETTRPMAKGEGFTVAVSFPKGVVTPPSHAQRRQEFLRDNIVLQGLWGAVVLLMAFYVMMWRSHGRDPAARAIVPLFYPPKGYSPAACRYIARMGEYDNQTLSAAMISLAVKGYWRIEQGGKGKSGDYTVIRDHSQSDHAPLSKGEQALATMMDATNDPMLAFYEMMEDKLPSIPFLGGLALTMQKQMKSYRASKQQEQEKGETRLKLEAKNQTQIRGAILKFTQTLTKEYDDIYFKANEGKSWIGGLGALIVVALGMACFALRPDVTPAFMATAMVCAFLGGFCVFGLTRSVIKGLAQPLKRSFVPPALLSATVLGIILTAIVTSIDILSFNAHDSLGDPLYTSLEFWAPAGGIYIVAVMQGMFGYLIKAPTRRGRRLVDAILGFRMFLAATEKDRLNVLHSPEKTPELFEEYLPYAIALDVENDWAEQFTDVFARIDQTATGQGTGRRGYSPSWYSGGAMASAGAVGSFIGNLSSGLSDAANSAAYPGGSGSSGSGGGGSSGGGGGGGGGGGW